MTDTAGHGAPELDTARHTLTIRDVEALLMKAGVQRSHRHVLRMCQAGMLDAVKFAGPSGEEWHIAPASVPRAIGDLKHIDTLRSRRSGSQPAAAGHDALEDTANHARDTEGYGVPQPAMTDEQESQEGSAPEPATAGYVAQLEKRIEEKDEVIGLLKGQLVAKDEQIGELSTRYRETHTLLGAMQRMLAPMLGQGDPYGNAPEAREAQDDATPQATGVDK